MVLIMLIKVGFDMKKFLCAILAVAVVFSLAACSKKPTEGNDENTTLSSSVWPDNAFFKDIPAIDGTITLYQDNKNESGYTYSFFVDGVDYKSFCSYIAELEKAGFGIYSSSPLNTQKTEDMLPEKLDDGVYNATWLGKRRGVYVAAQWYGDEYYEANGLPADSNVRLVFYTYNPFAN